MQRVNSLLRCADNQRISQTLKLVPLRQFVGPRLSRRKERRNHKNLACLKIVPQQFLTCRERDRRLAEAHIEEQARGLMLKDKLLSKSLIGVGRVFHACTPISISR